MFSNANVLFRTELVEGVGSTIRRTVSNGAPPREAAAAAAPRGKASNAAGKRKADRPALTAAGQVN